MTDLSNTENETVERFVLEFMVGSDTAKWLVQDEKFNGIIELPDNSDGYQFDGKKVGIRHFISEETQQFLVYTKTRCLAFPKDDPEFPNRLFNVVENHANRERNR